MKQSTIQTGYVHCIIALISLIILLLLAEPMFLFLAIVCLFTGGNYVIVGIIMDIILFFGFFYGSLWLYEKFLAKKLISFFTSFQGPKNPI